MYERCGELLSLRFEISRVEDLGADRLVYGKLDERFNRCPVVANLPASFTQYCIETGATYDFGVPSDDVRFFDSNTGIRTQSGPL
jgi:multiple sugar transport system ATP-binding protein